LKSWPSSMSKLAPDDLSRVVVFPLKSIRRTVYCFCSSKRIVRLINFVGFVDFCIRLRREVDESVTRHKFSVGSRAPSEPFPGKDVSLV